MPESMYCIYKYKTKLSICRFLECSLNGKCFRKLIHQSTGDMKKISSVIYFGNTIPTWTNPQKYDIILVTSKI